MRAARSHRRVLVAAIALIAAIFAVVPAPAAANGSAPTITGLQRGGSDMSTGPADGGTVVTLTGTGFESATSVSFGGVTAQVFSVDSATQITATTPQGSAGAAVDVAVVTPNGTASRPSAFTYAQELNLVEVSLPAGAVWPNGLALSPDGRWIYVAGSGNPGPSGRLTVFDARPNLISETPTIVETITVQSVALHVKVAPTGFPIYVMRRVDDSYDVVDGTRTVTESRTVPGLRDVAIASGGARIFGSASEYHAASAPHRIYSFDSATGAVLDSVTVTNNPAEIALHPAGRYVFVNAASEPLITIVDVQDSLTVTETISLTAKPTKVAFSLDGSKAYVSHTESGTVTVIGLSSAGLPESTSTIGGLPGAYALAVSPDGKYLYVTSHYLNVVWKVRLSTSQVIDAISLPWQSQGYGYTFTGVATAPDGNYTYLTHTDYSRLYALQNPPSITSVTPATGTTAGGTSVTINGFGFTGATSVTIGGVLAETRTVTATQITAIAPPGTAGAVSIVVTGSGGVDTKTAAFTYVTPTPPARVPTDPAVTLSSVSPNSGPTSGGTQVTITGRFPSSIASVTFNGVPATSFAAVDSNRVTAVTPPGVAGPATVIISASGGNGSLGGGFTYVTPPTQPTTETSTGSASGAGSTITAPIVRSGAAVVTFATKSSILSATNRKTIQRLVTTSGMDARYRIKGYSTTSASAQTLARARARAIQRLLIELGVAYSRISTEFNSKVAKQAQLVALTDR